MRVKKQIVFIERLDLLNLPLAIGLACVFSGAYYSTSCWPLNASFFRYWLDRTVHLKKLPMTQFPGSYKSFCQLAIDHFNPMYMRDHFSKAIQFKLQQLAGHALIMTAFEKTLAERYTTVKTRAWTLMDRLAASEQPILYVPVDRGFLESEYPPSLSCHAHLFQTPSWILGYTAICARVESIAALVYALGATLFLIGQRGIRWRRPSPQSWKIGVDIHNTGIPWNAPYRESIAFDGQRIRAKDALHVVRNRLQDERSRSYYKENNITFIEASKLPIPVSYLTFRLGKDFLLFSFLWTFKSLFQTRLVPFLYVANEILYHCLIRAEILDQAYPTDVFLARDEYGTPHILRTMLHHKRGAATIGFAHGACLYRQFALCYLSFDTFCYISPHQQKLLKSTSDSTMQMCHIGVGIYGLDRTYQLLQSKQIPDINPPEKKRYRVIGVLGDTFENNEDYDFGKTDCLHFYSTVISLLKEDLDIYLIICPKYREFLDPEIHALLPEQLDRVRLEMDRPIYEVLPLFDLAISASPTAGLESIARGCPTYFFDENRDRFTALEEVLPHIVVHSRDELYHRIGSTIQENNYFSHPRMEEFKESHGLIFDGKVCERYRSQVYELLNRGHAS